MKKVSLTCICCPLGCPLEVTLEEGKDPVVRGHTCPKGHQYGKMEVTAPTRTLTTTLPVPGGDPAMVPVKTAAPIPKGAVLPAMEALKGVTLTPPIALGQVVAENIAGTGVDLVATRDIPVKE